MSLTTPTVLPIHSTIELHDGELYPLDRDDGFWVVLEGSTDYIKIHANPGPNLKRQAGLYQAYPGDILIGRLQNTVSDHSFELLSVEESVLGFVEFSDIDECSQEIKEAAIEKLDTWVQHFSHLVDFDIPSTQNIVVDQEKPRPIVQDEALKLPGSGTYWLKVIDGSICLLGDEDATLMDRDGYILLGGNVWFRATQNSIVDCRSECPMGTTPYSEIVNNLSFVQNATLRGLQDTEMEVAREEAERLEKAADRIQSQTSLSLGLLANILDQKTVIEDTGDSLFTALSVIGQHIGVEFQEPSKTEDLERTEFVEAMCRASHVRYRNVELREGWWKEDNGSLLGALLSDDSEEGVEPVALLPNRGKSGYSIFSPSEGLARPLNSDEITALRSSAIMFYRPFPDETKSLWQLGRHAISSVWGQGVWLLVLSLAVTLFGMLTPVAYMTIIDTAIPDGNRGLLAELAACLLGVTLGTTIFNLTKGLVTMRFKMGIMLNMQAAVMDRLLNLPVKFFRKFSSGDLVNRSMIITEIGQEVSGVALNSIFSAITALLNLLLLFFYSWQLAIIPIVLSLFSALVTLFLGIRIRKQALEYELRSGKLFGMLVQIISSVSKFRVTGSEALAFNQWSRKYSELLLYLSRITGYQNFGQLFNSGFTPLGTILIYFFLMKMMGFGVEEGGPDGPITFLSMGTFMAFNVAFGTFMGGVTGLTGAVISVIDSLAKRELCKPIIEEKPELDQDKGDPGSLNGQIEIKDISFRYSSDGPFVLQGVDITILPGQFIALVGPSGCGKSTLFRLLLGFESPESGTMLFDDQDHNGLNMALVRRQIGTVLQTAALESGSIFDSIASGIIITLDEAWEAARDTGFDKDIEDMPMQMNTMVNEGGTNLSGGQRQRLLIARALVRNPKILLFDEATSALDNRTQEIVSKSLERRKVSRLVVAHRLSTIEGADQIYALEHGKIVQSGTFQELVEQPGLFQNMMRRQTL